jgi:quinol monooxygenase YgiN
MPRSSGVVMIIVIASIYIKEGKLSDYCRTLKANVPTVRNETGCIEYVPAGDIKTGLPAQVLERNVVTILERWESLEALNDHLTSPHMLGYREKVKDMVDRVSVKVLKELV